MWLPSPVYERVPQFWLLLGLLFMSSGTYLGFEHALSFVYFAVGFVCVIWSICVLVLRSRSRKFPVPMHVSEPEQPPQSTEQSTEQQAQQPTEQQPEQPG